MSSALNPELIFLVGVAVFWTALYIVARVFRLNNHGLNVKPAYFMYRSKRLNLFLDRVMRRWRSLWEVLSNIGLAFSVGLMIFSIYFLANNLIRFAFPIGQVAPVFPVIVGLTIRLYWLPYFFLAVCIVVLTHELAHGITARLENIPVLSSGIFAVLVFPGAFVEPDEKKFEKASILSRLRMLAAGSSTNLVTALLAFLLLNILFAPPAGILIHEVVPGGPLDRQARLQNWDVIKAINGTPMHTYLDFYDFMESVNPNDTLVLTVVHANEINNVTIRVEMDDAGQPTPGMYDGWASYQPSRLGLDQYTTVNLFWVLFWIYLIALSVAIFNMFPLYPFDGERVLYYPLARLVGGRKRELRWALSISSLVLIASNMVLSLARFGLPSI